MSLFSKKTEDSKKTTPIEPIEKKAEFVATSKVKDDFKSNIKPGSLIIKPLISEKAMILSEKNAYVFVINPKANKSEAKKEIEKIYNVDIVKININKYRRKSKSFRGLESSKKILKKAIVTVKNGQKIEIFNK